MPFKWTNISLFRVSTEAAPLTCLFSSHYYCQFLTVVNLPPFWSSFNLLQPERSSSMKMKLKRWSQAVSCWPSYQTYTEFPSAFPTWGFSAHAPVFCAIISHFYHNHLIQCQLLLHHVFPNLCLPEFSTSVSCHLVVFCTQGWKQQDSSNWTP